jgi:hypothetical protein
MSVAIPPLLHMPSCHVQGNIFCQVVVTILPIDLLAFVCVILFASFANICFGVPKILEISRYYLPKQNSDISFF